MIKAKVIKPFYYAKDKELYLDEDRYSELKEKGLVEKIKDIEMTANIVYADGKEIYKAVTENKMIEKATNDKKRVLSDQGVETDAKDNMA